MALRIVWTARARAHLRDVLDLIAFDNPPAAKALARKVFTAVDRLAEYPHAGHMPPELDSSPFREWLVPPCRVIYLVRGDAVIILVVIRSERLLSGAMLSR